jgi:hypothetical protein
MLKCDFIHIRIIGFMRQMWFMRLLTVIVIALLSVISSCNDDGGTIENPFSNGKDTIVVLKDTWNYHTIQGLHAGLFKPTCANSGCHDGNFEPDFRTVESSYYSLVQQPVTKKDIAGSYLTRVIPENATGSMLPYRMKTDLNGNSGIMPLSLEPTSKYPIEKDSWVARVNAWINDGAKDWLGRTPTTIDFPPQLLGVQALQNGIPLPRAGKYEVAKASAGSNFELWFSLSDDNTPVGNLTNATINWSTDPAKFDPTKEQSLKKGINKTLSGLFSSNCDYLWYFPYDGAINIKYDVVWFRITVSDAKNKDYTIPNINSMFFLKTYCAVKFY